MFTFAKDTPIACIPHGTGQPLGTVSLAGQGQMLGAPEAGSYVQSSQKTRTKAFEWLKCCQITPRVQQTITLYEIRAIDINCWILHRKQI